MTSQKKFKKLMVTVLSPFRSEASFGRYQKAMGSAKGVHTTASFAGHPLFIGAHRERVLEVLKKFSKKEKDKTYFIFTAHSIPKSMSKKSAYVREFSTASRLTAKSLGLRRWALAYQSRSTRGGPEPWLEPSIEEALSKVSKKEFKNIFFIPVGFLVDHKEVLYDLDIQAREQAERLGFNYFRSRTLMDHPKFIRLLAKLVTKALSSPRSPNRHSRML